MGFASWPLFVVEPEVMERSALTNSMLDIQRMLSREDGNYVEVVVYVTGPEQRRHFVEDLGIPEHLIVEVGPIPLFDRKKRSLRDV